MVGKEEGVTIKELQERDLSGNGTVLDLGRVVVTQTYRSGKIT